MRAGLLLLFLAGIALILMGYGGERKLAASGFSEGSGFHAVHALSGDVSAMWKQEILPALENRTDAWDQMQSGGKIVLTEMDNQNIPYDGPLTGKVDVAVRPENLQIDPAGALSGRLETKYYLGDVSDFRVRSGSEQVRVIAPGAAFPDLAEGQEVRFSIREFLVYEDDGSLEEMLQIRS